MGVYRNPSQSRSSQVVVDEKSVNEGTVSRGHVFVGSFPPEKERKRNKRAIVLSRRGNTGREEGAELRKPRISPSYGPVCVRDEEEGPRYADRLVRATGRGTIVHSDNLRSGLFGAFPRHRRCFLLLSLSSGARLLCRIIPPSGVCLRSSSRGSLSAAAALGD